MLRLAAAAAFVSLLSPALAQRLIATDSNRSMWVVDPATAQRTQIGTVTANVGIPAGLAFDPGSGTVWCVSSSTDSLYRLDVATGTGTLVGPFGGAQFVMHGVEFDLTTGTLYGVSQHDNGLYVLDQTTGAATLVGLTGLSGFTNLALDVVANVLYASNSGTDSLYTIDRATGAATLVGALSGPTQPNGLAYDLASGTLYLADNILDTLYRVDRTTGAATLIGSLGQSNLLGLVVLPGGGSIVRQAHGCGPTTIQVTGQATPGGTLATTLGNVTGVPFIGLGFGAPVPFCTCTLGHSWSFSVFGSTSSLPVPNNPVFVGTVFGIQGADLLGTGGCANPQVTLTDSFVVTIG